MQNSTTKCAISKTITPGELDTLLLLDPAAVSDVHLIFPTAREIIEAIVLSGSGFRFHVEIGNPHLTKFLYLKANTGITIFQNHPLCPGQYASMLVRIDSSANQIQVYPNFPTCSYWRSFNITFTCSAWTAPQIGIIHFIRNGPSITLQMISTLSGEASGSLGYITSESIPHLFWPSVTTSFFVHAENTAGVGINTWGQILDTGTIRITMNAPGSPFTGSPKISPFVVSYEANFGFTIGSPHETRGC